MLKVSSRNGKLFGLCWKSANLIAKRALSICSLENNGQSRLITVAFDDGTRGTWPYAWLRDNSPDGRTFHMGGDARARLMRMDQMHTDISPREVHLASEGGELCIVWPAAEGEEDDGSLTSHYTASWLHRRNIASASFRRHRVGALHTHNYQLWDAEVIGDNLPRAHYSELCNDAHTQEARLRLLQGFVDYGIALVDGLPREEGQMEKMKHMFGHVHRTHYGAAFTVRADDSPNNVAYTSEALGLHTDLPYCVHQPDIQALLVIEQASGGGESIFADGFAVAEHMRVQQPQLYDALVSIPIEFIDYTRADGDDQLLMYRRPTLELDGIGEPRTIYYSGQQRGWFIDAPPNDVRRLYEAIKAFDQLLHSDQYRLDLKLDNGTMVIFGNNRVLHGRRAYEDGAAGGGHRHLVGAYYTWDAVLSRLRVLKRTMGHMAHATIDDGR